MRDQRYVPARRKIADDRANRHGDRKHVEHRARETPGLVFFAMRDVFGERRDERAYQRAVKDAEENRRNRCRREKVLHLPTGSVVARADDLAEESRAASTRRSPP